MASKQKQSVLDAELGFDQNTVVSMPQLSQEVYMGRVNSRVCESTELEWQRESAKDYVQGRWSQRQKRQVVRSKVYMVMKNAPLIS